MSDTYFGSRNVPAAAVARVGGADQKGEDPVAKAERLMAAIEAEEARIAKGGGEDPIAKSERLLAEVEASAADPMEKRGTFHNDPAGLLRIKSRDITDFAKTLGIGTGEGAYDELRRRATRADVDRFLNSPAPAKTLGPGAFHVPSR